MLFSRSLASSSQSQRLQLQCCRIRESTQFFANRTESPPARSGPRLGWPRRRRVICWCVGLLPVSLEFCSWSCHFSHGVVLAALGNSWIPNSGLRPPAFGAIGNQTTGVLRAASSYCLSDATVCAEFIFYARRGAAAGAASPPAFALGPSPLPAQSDGFSETIISVDPGDRQGSISARTGAGMWDCSCSFCTQVVLIDFM